MDDKIIVPKQGGKLRRGGPGRPKGVPNKATIEIKDFARRLLANPKYEASLRRRLENGEAPHMETLLHHYAFGKPKDEAKIEMTGTAGAPQHIVVRVIPPERPLPE